MASSKKPYTGLKISASKFYSERTRFLKEQMGKESELEKPYAGADRMLMHLDLPLPDWGGPVNHPDNRRTNLRAPHIRIKRFGPLAIPRVTAVFGSSCKSCTVVCNEPTECGDSIDCYAAIFCTGDATGFGRDTKWDVSVPVGEVIEVAPGGESFPSISVFVNGDKVINVVEICLIDGLGHRCCVTVELECCDCGSSNPLVFDSAVTDDTIAPGGTSAVGISGGCPPYTWSVSGTGYTIPATTTGLTNTLTSAAGT